MTRSVEEPGSVDDLHGLEVVEILQPPLGAVDQRAVIGVAFGEIELAANHVVARAGVAADVDALDIGARAFVDREHDRTVCVSKLRSPRGRTIAKA